MHDVKATKALLINFFNNFLGNEKVDHALFLYQHAQGREERLVKTLLTQMIELLILRYTDGYMKKKAESRKKKKTNSEKKIKEREWNK